MKLSTKSDTRYINSAMSQNHSPSPSQPVRPGYPDRLGTALLSQSILDGLTDAAMLAHLYKDTPKNLWIRALYSSVIDGSLSVCQEPEHTDIAMYQTSLRTIEGEGLLLIHVKYNDQQQLEIERVDHQHVDGQTDYSEPFGSFIIPQHPIENSMAASNKRKRDDAEHTIPAQKANKHDRLSELDGFIRQRLEKDPSISNLDIRKAANINGFKNANGSELTTIQIKNRRATILYRASAQQDAIRIAGNTMNQQLLAQVLEKERQNKKNSDFGLAKWLSKQGHKNSEGNRWTVLQVKKTRQAITDNIKKQNISHESDLIDMGLSSEAPLTNIQTDYSALVPTRDDFIRQSLTENPDITNFALARIVNEAGYRNECGGLVTVTEIGMRRSYLNPSAYNQFRIKERQRETEIDILISDILEKEPGISNASLAKRLNQAGHVNRIGNPWSAKVVSTKRPDN